MLGCDTVMRQLWDFLDGELSEERMAAIRAHVDMCKRCYPQFDFERRFLDKLHSARREHGHVEELRQQVMKALESDGYAA
jgi:anti-sigma factor (TIGR02949 family)